jgi:hypothetical protein
VSDSQGECTHTSYNSQPRVRAPHWAALPARVLVVSKHRGADPDARRRAAGGWLLRLSSLPLDPGVDAPCVRPRRGARNCPDHVTWRLVLSAVLVVGPVWAMSPITGRLPTQVRGAGGQQLRTAPLLLHPVLPPRSLRRASRRVARAAPGGAYRRSHGVQAAAAGVNGKGNVPLTQDTVLVPFDAAAKDAERALAEARAIILSSRRALAATDPYSSVGDEASKPAEKQLQGATAALESLKASLAAVRGGRLPVVDAQQGVTAVTGAWSALKAASALLTAQPATAQALASVTAALQRLSSIADVYSNKVLTLAR